MIRLARKEDREDFLVSWKEFIQESLESGGDLLPTDRTMGFFGRMFDAYESGELSGVVVIDDESGACLIWGATTPEPLMDSVYGIAAHGFGTYVPRAHRGKGISSRMRELGEASLVELGFDAAYGTVIKGNAMSWEIASKRGIEIVGLNVVLKRLRG